MPNGLAAIIKKEFIRFFTDRRMFITTVIMPGLMIYVIYSFIGVAATNMISSDSGYQPSIYAVNMPASAKALFSQANISPTEIPAAQADSIKQQIQDRTADLLVIFPDGFDATLANRESTGVAAYTPPNIAIYSNSTNTESGAANALVTALLNTYNTPVITINATVDSGDLATEQDSIGTLFSSILPLLMLIFLYSGCVGVAPESIAGEKERGTIATLLVTPLRRWQLALGKVISLGLIALLAGASSFLGILLSVPKLLNSALAGADGSTTDPLISANLYSAGDYLMLLVIILSTVLLFIGLISIISAWARTVREANTMMLPFMIIIMLVGVMGIFTQGGQSSPFLYLIPVYNSVESLVGVFSFNASPLFVTLTVCMNLLVTAACVFALTKMFNNEKVIFSR